MPNYAKLKTELATDPLKLGYQDWINRGADADVAAMLNALTGAGSGPVTLTRCSPLWFYGGIAQASLRIAQQTDQTVVARWGQHVPAYLPLLGNGPIDMAAGSAPALVAQAVADGVLQQAEAAALTSRTGSRAEAIGFFDSLSEVPQQLTHQHVAQALRS